MRAKMTGQEKQPIKSKKKSVSECILMKRNSDDSSRLVSDKVFEK